MAPVKVEILVFRKRSHRILPPENHLEIVQKLAVTRSYKMVLKIWYEIGNFRKFRLFQFTFLQSNQKFGFLKKFI